MREFKIYYLTSIILFILRNFLCLKNKHEITMVKVDEDLACQSN